MYADDILLHKLTSSSLGMKGLQDDVPQSCTWICCDHITFNVAKMKFMITSHHHALFTRHRGSSLQIPGLVWISNLEKHVESVCYKPFSYMYQTFLLTQP